MSESDDLFRRLDSNRQWILGKINRTMPVDCKTCVACCRSMSPMLYPEAGDDPSKYETTVVFDQYWGGERHMLARRADGACRYLSDERGCTIHATRPRVCRSYDCSEQFEMYSRADRRRLKRNGEWNEVRQAGERIWLIKNGKRVEA